MTIRNIVRRIGPDWFITIPDGQTAQRTFEYAAWYESLALEPGTYQFKWVPDRYRGRWSVTIPATVTDAYFPAGFAGVNYYSKESEAKDKKLIGEARDYHISTDDYAMRETELEEGPDDLRYVFQNLDSIRQGIKNRDWHTHTNKKHWQRLIDDANRIIKTLKEYQDKETEEDWR